MSERKRIRALFTALENQPTAESENAKTVEPDTILNELADSVAPSDVTIELLVEDTPAFEPPATWHSSGHLRWERVVGELDRQTPELNVLLRDARQAANVKTEELAHILGWEPAAYERLETGRAGGALVNASADSICALATRLGISPTLLVSSVAKAFGSDAGLAYGHRPRSVGEVLVSSDQASDRERLNAWARQVLVKKR